MATPPSEIRTGLTIVTAEALAEATASLSAATPAAVVEAATDTLSVLLPPFYDATAALALTWYEELRDEVPDLSEYVPHMPTEANPDWIVRELADDLARIEQEFAAEVDRGAAAMLAEAEALVQKEVARGFRDTMTGNVRDDAAAIGWSRHARPGACKFCRMAARDSVVYRTERAARFSAHTSCHCIARAEFAGGQHGPEADALQYVASKRKRTPAERAALREYLNRRYPDAPG